MESARWPKFEPARTRLEINQAAAIKKLLLITSNPQLDDLFASAAA